MHSGDLNVKEVQKSGDICICLPDLFCGAVETRHCEATITKIKINLKNNMKFGKEAWNGDKD